MSRPHQLWLYTGKGDKSRINSADLSADELRDEVRRLTCLSTKDTIVLTSARPPYNFDHLPSEAPVIVRCYPPTPESGVEPEDDDDNSEGTEDAQQVLEDSDVQEGDTAEDAAFTRSKRRLQIDDDFITTAESSPSDQDNDAVGTPPPSPVDKGPSGFFAAEDDLDLSDDDLVPLAKRAKLTAERTSLAKEPVPSSAKQTPPTRTAVEKIPVSKVIPPGDAPTSSASRDHLWKSVKSSADQVLEANRLATDAKNENVSLKRELSKLKQQMKDEQEARRSSPSPWPSAKDQRSSIEVVLDDLSEGEAGQDPWRDGGCFPCQLFGAGGGIEMPLSIIRGGSYFPAANGSWAGV
ncbi:hypothetical protein QYE76_049420 [Lolium multiflorum]|uniref:Uncharacterized protein n=1 Tax=Lolium multiflorum TaxID=4521 RepID=A0AAD8SN20_LOLMU|nr:hypothetical protein QYE76_049420 [Lolium multiflorum]